MTRSIWCSITSNFPKLHPGQGVALGSGFEERDAYTVGRPELQPYEKRSDVLRARVTIAEKAFVVEQAARAGLDVTEYVRRRCLGFQVAPAQPSPHMANAALVSELNSIGINLNQIARNLNSDRPLRINAEEVLGELRRVMAEVL
tara:strand:- start:8501 stop:8935 length:435 start_codon:yes stop_codon:yes gene_type:complete